MNDMDTDFDNELEECSRREWLRREQLHPRSAAPTATMDPDQQRLWDAWATRLIDNRLCAFRIETSKFVKKSAAVAMKILRDEIDFIISEVEDEKTKAHLQERLRQWRKQRRDDAIREKELADAAK
jgi:hypothetical protein